jgi:hypothetical protein
MYIVFTQKQKAISVIGPSRCVPTDLGRPHGQLAILNIYQQGHYMYSTFCINIPTTHVGVWGGCVPHTVFLGLPAEREVRLVSQSKEDTVLCRQTWAKLN